MQCYDLLMDPKAKAIVEGRRGAGFLRMCRRVRNEEVSDKKSRTVGIVQFAIDAVGDLQLLRRRHQSLFLCQFVQPF